MKNERRKLGKRKALIFAVLLVIQAFISVGCTSAITIYANSGESPQASFQVRSGMTVLSNNDTIRSGSQLVRYTYGMSVYNTNDTSDTVLGNLKYILQADNIIDVDDEEYADWNESYVKWFFPSNYSLVEDDWLYVSAETSFFETKYIPMSMSRRLNKTIFDSDSYQLGEFNVTFDEINFDSCTGIITAEENSLVNASFVLDTLSVDEPFELDYKILDEHYIEFYVYNVSQLQANKTYKFSVVVRVDLKGNNPSPILYKPEYEILFGPHRRLYPDYIGSNVTIPSEGLPEHIHYACASTNGSNTWYIPRQPHTTTSCRLEEISDPLGPTISILTPADAAIALQLAASGAYDPAADVSGDDRVTSLDALMILQAAAGAISL